MLRLAAVMGHSMGSVAALHLAANTDLCQSVIFLDGPGISPQKYVHITCSICAKRLVSLV